MGQIATVESTIRTTENGIPVRDVQCDPAGGSPVSAELVLPPGVDAQPLPGDSAFIEDGPGEGKKIATGFVDPKNEFKASDGEHRAYARDGDGELVAEIWAKGSGEIVIEVVKTGGAPIRIKTDGPVILDSPDVRLSDAAGQPVARVGDMVTGSILATSTSPGSAIAPGGPGPPVPFAGQIVSGQSKVKA